jgi:hypothetical protein
MTTLLCDDNYVADDKEINVVPCGGWQISELLVFKIGHKITDTCVFYFLIKLFIPKFY